MALTTFCIDSHAAAVKGELEDQTMLERLLVLGDETDQWACSEPVLLTDSRTRAEFPMLPIASRHTNKRSSTRQDSYDLDNGESDSRHQRSSGSDDRGRTSGTSTKRTKGHRKVMSAEERIERRREGNRRAAQRLRARRVATVAELKEHIMALESEKQAFMDDLSQLASSCQLVVEENQWLRSRLESLEKRKLDKETPHCGLPTSLAHMSEVGPGSPELECSSRSKSMQMPIVSQSCRRSSMSPVLEPVSLAFSDVQGPDTPPGSSPSDARYLRGSSNSSIFGARFACNSCPPKSQRTASGATPLGVRAPATPLPGSTMQYCTHQCSCGHSRRNPSLESSFEPLPLFEWLP
eukprot:jgi/Botrbrau1/19498/Bobra.0671s0001.1